MGGAAAGMAAVARQRPSLPGGPYQLAPEPSRWATTSGDLGGSAVPLASKIPPKFRKQVRWPNTPQRGLRLII